MEMKMEVSLQTKQVMSQAQVQSLNILAMSMTELQEYLQKEEIENPLVELADGAQPEQVPVTYREYAYVSVNRTEQGTGVGDMYERAHGGESIEDMVMAQLPWNQIGDTERRIVEFCVNSLDQSGYLSVSPEEIAEKLFVEAELAEQVLSQLKELEPRGIFSSNLEECLLCQIRGMEEETLLGQLIRDHLEHMAEGRISSITRALKISSADARKLIHTIKRLNPRPLNGYGEERTQYILPDILLEYQDGQWMIGLNDKWTGSFGISEFYVRMMETTRDLFTTGISSGADGEMSVSRNAVKEKVRELVSAEDKTRPYSDEQLAKLLGQEGMAVSRRTVAKYRAELGIGGVFQRREV